MFYFILNISNELFDSNQNLRKFFSSCSDHLESSNLIQFNFWSIKELLFFEYFVNHLMSWIKNLNCPKNCQFSLFIKLTMCVPVFQCVKLNLKIKIWIYLFFPIIYWIHQFPIDVLVYQTIYLLKIAYIDKLYLQFIKII